MDMKIDLNQAKLLEGKMKNIALHKLPSAYKKALNQTARDINEAEVGEMKRVFDRPTPFTLRSTYVWYGRDYNEIGIRFEAGKGTPAEKYLRPQVHGGDRNLKRFEKALQAKGILPRGMCAVPGSGATLDSYGNMSRGQIVKVLSYFSAFGEQGYMANMTDKKRDRMARGTKKTMMVGMNYFAVRTKKGPLTPGIYAKYSYHARTALKCILIFVRKPQYKPVLDFKGKGERVFYERFPENLWMFSGDALGGK